MEEAIERLEKRHKEHIILYDPSGVSGGSMFSESRFNTYSFE